MMTRPGSDSENALSLKTSMTLRKGATFHSPTSPASSTTDLTYTPPRLSRSQSHLDDVVDANRRRMALALDDIDQALSLTEELSLSPKSPKAPKSNVLRDAGIPIPRGLLDLPVVDPAMAKEAERRVLRPRSVRHSRHHASDSGLGTSVASTHEKCATETKNKKAHITRSAITHSPSPSTMERLPSLGSRAISRIHEHILRPLRAKPTLKDFEPIVLDIPRRIQAKEIICLRDLEKTLIFMAPERTKTAPLYLDFCFTSIQCIQATVEYLSDREQTRLGDRPYTNGYFIDLKDQILEYGRQLAAAKGSPEDMDIDASDEIKLVGGIAENGRPAELVRVRKDGTHISMATGKVLDLEESPIKVKRSLSEQREDEEEIMRSMARRKKNLSPEELAPKKCREPGCNKEFKRPCDLTKHEKTHSRPWKCPIVTCKYHTYGWPTEKEMDRHINDKHSEAPAMFHCLFSGCVYKSKRESNCKQHMEKAHGWTYIRTKTNGRANGKKLSAKASATPAATPAKPPSSTVQPTPPLGNMSTPSTTPAYSVPTPPQESTPQFMGSDFPLYPSDSDWMSTYGIQPDNLEMDLVLENPSPASTGSYEQFAPYQNGSAFILNDEDLYAAHVRIPTLPATDLAIYNTPLNQKMIPQQMPMFEAPQHCPAPAVAPHFSPVGQQNAMLFTPNSLRDVDEGFDDSFGADGMDFQLFPSTLKANDVQPLFGEVPSAGVGFSQTSQQDIFPYDWSNNVDLQNFQE